MISTYRKALTFFAHPDDEVLAAGATIKRLTREGCIVHVAIPNTGVHSRRMSTNKKKRDMALIQLRADCFKALSVLGIRESDVYLGEFSDNEIDKHTLLELINWFEKILNKVEPEVVFTHHRYCTNIDHQYCHEAAVVATRPGVDSHIPIYCAEVPSSTGYLKPVQWEPNFFINVQENDVEAKIKAMQTYKDEARSDPHPRSPEVLKALAKVRGSESGFMFAEAYMVQKMFII